MLLGGAEYWILGLLRYADPARIEWSGVAMTSTSPSDESLCRQAAAFAPLYGGPVREGRGEGLAAADSAVRFSSSREALRKLCADSDVLIVWGVAHLGPHLKGLGFTGQVVLVSHGGGAWTESSRKTACVRSPPASA